MIALVGRCLVVEQTVNRVRRDGGADSISWFDGREIKAFKAHLTHGVQRRAVVTCAVEMRIAASTFGRGVKAADRKLWLIAILAAFRRENHAGSLK